MDTGVVAAAEVGEDADGELDLGISLLLDGIREDVIGRDDVATREFIATRVAREVAESVPGREETMAVCPEVKYAVQSARDMPLTQQPKVVQ